MEHQMMKSRIAALLPIASLLTAASLPVTVLAALTPGSALAQEAKSCVTVSNGLFKNVCSYTVDIAWCATTPTKNCVGFDSGDTLSPGETFPVNDGAPYTDLYYAACNSEGNHTIDYGAGSLKYRCI
jgi:hypothetical protein